MTPNTNDLTSHSPGAEPEPEWFYDEEGRIVSADGVYYEDYLATLEGDDLASAPYYEASSLDGQIWEQTVPEGWEEYLPQEESPVPVSDTSQPWTPPDEGLPDSEVSAREEISYAGVGSYHEEPEPEPFPLTEETALPAAKETRVAGHGFSPAAERPRTSEPSHHAHKEAGSQPIVARASSSTVDRAARQELARSLESQKSLALPEGEVLLSTRGLVKVYDGRAVVNGVDIYVRPGEIVGLLGPNGAGKTTTFYMIVGLVPPFDGTVLFEGHDVTRRPMYERARLGMGYLPQEESIFRKLTVEQNIMAVLETLTISKTERRERCQHLLQRFGIEHIAKNIALTCSGGEKRRLTIARSLVTEPSLLMLDEPFSGVDPIAVGEIQDIICDLRESGLAILITDHNVRETLHIVDRAYLIFEGRVLREGTQDYLINDPVSRELYLGEHFSM